jgi:hypothetical protein
LLITNEFGAQASRHKDIVDFGMILGTAVVMVAVIAAAASGNIKWCPFKDYWVYWLFGGVALVIGVGEFVLWVCDHTLNRELCWAFNKFLWFVGVWVGYVLFQTHDLRWLFMITTLSNVFSLSAARAFFFPFLSRRSEAELNVRYNVHTVIYIVINYYVCGGVAQFTLPAVDALQFTGFVT